MHITQLPAHTALRGQVMHRASLDAGQANSWGDARCITFSRYGVAPSDAPCITTVPPARHRQGSRPATVPVIPLTQL